MNEKIRLWRYCPKCGYGLQEFEEKGNGAEIYRCLNCDMRIPTPIDLEVKDDSNRR